MYSILNLLHNGLCSPLTHCVQVDKWGPFYLNSTPARQQPITLLGLCRSLVLPVLTERLCIRVTLQTRSSAADLILKQELSEGAGGHAAISSDQWDAGWDRRGWGKGCRWGVGPQEDSGYVQTAGKYDPNPTFSRPNPDLFSPQKIWKTREAFRKPNTEQKCKATHITSSSLISLILP